MVARAARRLAFLVTCSLLIWGSGGRHRALADYEWTAYFPNVRLTTQDNKETHFYDDLIKDKTAIINFMYTRCEVCERGIKNLVQVQKALGNRLGREVFIYSITIDPEHDTPKVLKAYAKAHGAKRGWTFLTGKPEDIAALRRALGVSNPDPELRRKLGLAKANADKGADDKQHVGLIVIVSDVWRKKEKTPVLSSPSKILQIVEGMKPAPTRQK